MEVRAMMIEENLLENYPLLQDEEDEDEDEEEEDEEEWEEGPEERLFVAC